MQQQTHDFRTQAIRAILNQHPDLHIWGNGIAHGINIDDYEAARQELLTPSRVHAIHDAVTWCSAHLVGTTPNSRKDGSTYQWKHSYEQATGIYIPNGSFAVAAALAGLPMTWNGYNPTIHAYESRQNPIYVVQRSPESGVGECLE